MLACPFYLSVLSLSVLFLFIGVVLSAFADFFCCAFSCTHFRVSFMGLGMLLLFGSAHCCAFWLLAVCSSCALLTLCVCPCSLTVVCTPSLSFFVCFVFWCVFLAVDLHFFFVCVCASACVCLFYGGGGSIWFSPGLCVVVVCNLK